ncbi:MAG: glycosyl hydrolase family 28-related protein [Rhodoferax sp.]|nr:glycosyl hydrolase family 28-related protein [Rhodoferax sp.]
MKTLAAPSVRGALTPIATLLLCSVVGMAGAQTTSKLWGVKGELWKNGNRISNFASAGYKSQKSDIPDRAVVKNVKDFGAVGDGVANDTNAFIKAIAATENGALLIPQGRYRVQDVLKITKSNITLKGEGQGQSVLVFPKSLSELMPEQKADWPFKGGFVWIEGEQNGGPLSRVIGEETRGSATLTLEDIRDIAVGQTLRLVQFDNLNASATTHTLIEHLQGKLPAQPGQVAYVAAELGDAKKLVDWVFKVVAIKGNTITLDRPLRVDVKNEWGAQVYRHDPSVQDVGVEGLTFEFPGVLKKEHLKEDGFNAIFFRQVTDVWVRDVEIVDADYGINARAFVYQGQFQDITLRAQNRKGETCHHGINASILSQDNLFNRMRFDTYCTHDLTVEAYANSNVFENSTFKRATLDHHRAAAYDNLFTNLHTVDGTMLFKSGGAKGRGPQSGRHETFWNISANGKLPKALPGITEFPLMTVVGLNGYTNDTTGLNRWVESGTSSVAPQNIHQAQLTRIRGVYEAESAVTTGARVKTQKNTPNLAKGSFTGSGYVEFVNAMGDAIEWTVYAPKVGTYKLTFRYALDAPVGRSLAVQVGDDTAATAVMFAPTGSRSVWKDVSVTMPTPLKDNVPIKVRLSTTGGNGPALDSLTVRPK